MTVSSPSVHKTPRSHADDGENGNDKLVNYGDTFPTHIADTDKHDNRHRWQAADGYPKPTANDMSIVDRGANGGVAGTDMRLISHDLPECLIDIEGFNNHRHTRGRSPHGSRTGHSHLPPV